ncbi:hydroxypyruvate isomerase family protein [Ampullimonas aquatilis]|uniref:hydroxypyruvate isomerase family protein n=1 Tax=Ampullimonas aquatilis TaxID=1341549 RepID=UPI003C784E2F
MQFAANLSLLYTEVPVLARPALAAADGFAAAEIQFPYEVAAADLHQALSHAGLPLVLHNTPKGPWADDFGLAAVPGREADFADGLQQAIAYSRVLGNRLLHVMAGKVDQQTGAADAARATFVANLKLACVEAAKAGLTVVIEPINTRDVPGYWLNYQSQALSVMDEVGADNLKLMMDFYHAQIMEGDLITRFLANQARIAHVQIAGVPARGEPDVGEVDYRTILALLARHDTGMIGAEYKPSRGAVVNGTHDGLAWMKTLTHNLP